jgi:uncharacterized protein (TIGR03067 family)
MRLFILAGLLLTGLSCSTSKKSTMTSNPLNGTWIPVKEEIGGMALPAPAFAKQKLEIHEGTYTMTAESVDKGEVTYSGNKMDIYGKEGVNTGKHFMAIYKYENEELTICYNLAGNSYPESFDTKGKPMFFMAVFKKEAGK